MPISILLHWDWNLFLEALVSWLCSSANCDDFAGFAEVRWAVLVSGWAGPGCSSAGSLPRTLQLCVWFWTGHTNRPESTTWNAPRLLPLWCCQWQRHLPTSQKSKCLKCSSHPHTQLWSAAQSFHVGENCSGFFMSKHSPIQALTRPNSVSHLTLDEFRHSQTGMAG